jgi:hypothetical protein
LLKRFAGKHRAQLLVIAIDGALADDRLDPGLADQLDMCLLGKAPVQDEAFEESKQSRAHRLDALGVLDGAGHRRPDSSQLFENHLLDVAQRLAGYDLCKLGAQALDLSQGRVALRFQFGLELDPV